MPRVHPEVAAAEERLAELQGQEQRCADPAAKSDIVLRVEMQRKIVDELRWQHTPRPLETQESIAAARDCTAETDWSPRV